jgi:hypothetical protein
MTIKTKDIRAVRGTTLRLTFTVRDERGAVVDLTGATAHLRVRPDMKAAAVITKSSPASGVVISTQTGATKGQYVATILHSDTASLSPGDYAWDSWVGTSGGDRFAVVAPSTLTLLAEVTTLP